jgi:hypothetical protein
MTRPNVLICACPDLAIDGQKLADRLTRLGVNAILSPPLCTPAGLQEWGPGLAGGRLRAGAAPRPLTAPGR